MKHRNLRAPPFMESDRFFPALKVRGLRKTFVRPAVDGLDLTIRAGEFYALLGPNGAGKTTTLRMVVGLLQPEAGDISVFGIDALEDPVAAKRIMAWVSDEPMIYDKLTPLRISRIRRRTLGHRRRAGAGRAEELIDWLGLGPHAHERCESFSRGMKQKVALAGALVHNPRLHHPRRAADRARRGLGAAGEGRAARAGTVRRHSSHDDPHPGSGRAHGRADRRDRRAAD